MDAKCSPGSSVSDSVETIRMTEARNDVMVEKCSRNVPTYQLRVYHAAGTILTNGEPFIGGGYPRTEQCYQFVKNELELRDATRLPSAIYELAITTTPEATFISGGHDGSQLNGFHQLNGVEWQPRTPLPIKVYKHCLVSIESSHLLHIGGYSGGVSKY